MSSFSEMLSLLNQQHEREVKTAVSRAVAEAVSPLLMQIERLKSQTLAKIHSEPLLPLAVQAPSDKIDCPLFTTPLMNNNDKTDVVVVVPALDKHFVAEPPMTQPQTNTTATPANRSSDRIVEQLQCRYCGSPAPVALNGVKPGTCVNCGAPSAFGSTKLRTMSDESMLKFFWDKCTRDNCVKNFRALLSFEDREITPEKLQELMAGSGISKDMACRAVELIDEINRIRGDDAQPSGSGVTLDGFVDVMGGAQRELYSTPELRRLSLTAQSALLPEWA